MCLDEGMNIMNLEDYDVFFEALMIQYDYITCGG